MIIIPPNFEYFVGIIIIDKTPACFVLSMIITKHHSTKIYIETKALKYIQTSGCLGNDYHAKISIRTGGCLVAYRYTIIHSSQGNQRGLHSTYSCTPDMNAGHTSTPTHDIPNDKFPYNPINFPFHYIVANCNIFTDICHHATGREHQYNSSSTQAR